MVRHPIVGCYKYKLKDRAVEEIHATMISIGLPVIRVEQRDNGIYYFYEEPKTKKEYAFWTYTKHGELFFRCGLSTSSRKIVDGFLAVGLFSDDERDA